MVYQTLPLGPNQIRLIQIQPLKPDEDENTPIHCRLERIDLPTTKIPLRADGLPANYIDCERWATNPPRERSREDLLESFNKPLLDHGTTAQRVKRHVVNGVRRALHQPTIDKTDIFIPILGLMELITQEDITYSIENQELHHSFKMLWPLDKHDNPIPAKDGYTAQVPVRELPPFYSPLAALANADEPIIDPKNYMAMSYAWGDPNGPKHTIYLNGEPTEVRENLAAGLRQFRKMEYFAKGGKIWIDSLCINQNDQIEKAAQVQQMGRVYKRAGNIIVWLGEADEGSDLSIFILENMSKMLRAEYVEVFDNSDPILATAWREIAVVRAGAALRRFAQQTAKNTVFASEIFEGDLLHAFFRRPYWRRLWIIQELTNGRAGMPIVCGQRVTQWRYIRDAAIAYTEMLNLWHTQTARGTLNDHMAFHIGTIAKLEIRAHRKKLPQIPESISLPFRTVPSAAESFHLGSGLREALILASNADVFEPRDRVYGMLHIPSLPSLGIKVNYSTPLGQVYKEFAEACVRKGSPRDILFLLDGRGMFLEGPNGVLEEQVGVPSWVPDFGAVRSCRPGFIEGDWYASNNAAAFQNTTDVTYGLLMPELKEDQLHLHGFVADIIVGVGAVSPLDLAQDPRPWPDSFRKGVVQPGPVARKSEELEAVLNTMLNGYDTASLYQPGRSFLADKTPSVCWVLVAGSSVGGTRGNLSQGEVLKSFPGKCSCDGPVHSKRCYKLS